MLLPPNNSVGWGRKVRACRLVACVAVGLTLPSAATAAPIVWDFTAIVTDEAGDTGPAAEAAFSSVTGLDLAAFDLGDIFTGQVVIDLDLAGVDTATQQVADPSTGFPPLVPPFLEIAISDGLNAASPVSVPLAASATDSLQRVDISNFFGALILQSQFGSSGAGTGFGIFFGSSGHYRADRLGRFGHVRPFKLRWFARAI